MMMTTMTKTEVETIEVVDAVELELTVKEAQFLKDIIARIGGCPFDSDRKYASDIYFAMREVPENEEHEHLFEGYIQCSEKDV